MITIGIPMYNSIDFIAETLASVEKNLDYIERVIISDNCSTDGSDMVCRRFKKKHPDKVRFIRQRKNKGMVYNCEFVITRAKSDYFMLLGSHDILSDDFARRVTEEIQKNPDASMFYGNFVRFNESSKSISKSKEVLDYSNLGFDSTDTFDRIMRYIAAPKEKTLWFLAYTVYKTDVIKWIFHDAKKTSLMGGDHLYVSKALSKGRGIYVDGVYYGFRVMPHDSKRLVDRIKRHKKVFGRQYKFETVNFGKIIYKDFIDTLKPFSKGKPVGWEKKVYNVCKDLFLMCDSDVEWLVRVYVLGQDLT